jgi:hypothetical protein
MTADLIAELREAAKVERENACEQDFWHEELLLKAADALEAALSERDALLREEECHDEELHGWEQDLAQERALREASEARVTALEKALEPFARADRAIGDEPGPFRFETRNGYVLIDREDLRAARAALGEEKR